MRIRCWAASQLRMIHSAMTESCTTDACSAESGSCSFTPDDSARANETECFAFACDGELGCSSQEVSGACDDGIPCTVDVCEGDGSCSNTEDDSACDDGNACTENTCEQENGVGCVVTNTLFGSPCDDGEGCAGRHLRRRCLQAGLSSFLQWGMHRQPAVDRRRQTGTAVLN